MDDASVVAGIAEVARVHLGWQGRLEPSLRLVEDLGLDSIKQLTLAAEVENHFRVCLDVAEDEVVTVGDLVAAIRRAGVN
jgi:acyl carrier protein